MTEDRLTPLQIQHLPATSGWRRRAKPLWRSISGTSGPSHAGWTGGEISKGLSAAWKLIWWSGATPPASINAQALRTEQPAGVPGPRRCRVKFLRVQRRLFRDAAGN